MTPLARPWASWVTCTACDSVRRSHLPVSRARGISLTAVLHLEVCLSPWKLNPSWMEAGRPSYGSAFVP